MDSRESARIGDKAKRETEAFINNHIDDHAKGWPIMCTHETADSERGQKKDFRKTGILEIRMTG